MLVRRQATYDLSGQKRGGQSQATLRVTRVLAQLANLPSEYNEIIEQSS
jgi:hypothetical protein